MLRALAPQMEQNPVTVSVVCVGGKKVQPPDKDPGSVGSWCYDAEGTAGIHSLLSQSIDAGVELFVFMQNMNTTWRSFVGNEFATRANTTWLRSIVDTANAGGVEVGSYQLLLDARSATALNMCAPPTAGSLPNRGWDTLDPTTGKTCHIGAQAKCAGGPGCCALCGATAFYRSMEASMLRWWNETGVSAVAQDGALGPRACANESHDHHGLNDSIWAQFRAVQRTYHAYLQAPSHQRSRPASLPSVGYIMGNPGLIMEGGQAKVPGGYSELVFSLPRWVWIDSIRQSIIASDIGQDTRDSITMRNFPLTLSGTYHPSEPDPANATRWKPVTGYDSVGTLSPVEQHLAETEWALTGCFGTGASCGIRGRKLFDGPRSKALVRRWIRWAKRYRRVLSSEFVTLAHGTQCLWSPTGGSSDVFPDSRCNHTGLDAVLHRAPKAFYADIDERALAFVWNPTNRTVVTQLRAPLYYAGISRARGHAAAMVAQEDGASHQLALAANDTVSLPISLGPRALTWFVVTEARPAYRVLMSINAIPPSIKMCLH